MRRWSNWLLVCLFAGWWAGCAPTAIGGAVGYSVVRGHSMEPTFGPGDMVLTRSDLDHQVGDVVLAKIHGGMVVHRLVGRDATGGWRTKGDNNDFLDGWRVRDAEIVGRLWLIVPNGGTVLQWVAAHPFFSGWCAAVLSLVVGWPWRATWRAFGRSPTRP